MYCVAPVRACMGVMPPSAGNAVLLRIVHMYIRASNQHEAGQPVKFIW